MSVTCPSYLPTGHCDIKPKSDKGIIYLACVGTVCSFTRIWTSSWETASVIVCHSLDFIVTYELSHDYQYKSSLSDLMIVCLELLTLGKEFSNNLQDSPPQTFLNMAHMSSIRERNPTHTRNEFEERLLCYVVRCIIFTVVHKSGSGYTRQARDARPAKQRTNGNVN